MWAEHQVGVVGTPLKIGDRQRGVSASVVRVSRKKISTAGVGIYSQDELLAGRGDGGWQGGANGQQGGANGDTQKGRRAQPASPESRAIRAG